IDRGIVPPSASGFFFGGDQATSFFLSVSLKFTLEVEKKSRLILPIRKKVLLLHPLSAT
ncbi:hypothetical protein HMPREF1554_02203, partial [Porphyromonas gingivalis F0569]